jgi:4-aminobutyrate aminotransferase
MSEIAPQPRSHTRSEQLVGRERAVIGDVMKIRFYPFIPVSAKGTRLTDADGNEYLDLIASAAVVQAGYGHPRIRDAITDQLDTLSTTMHCCYPSAVAVELAERLCGLVPGEFPQKVWFGTTGSDANDCVSRLAPMATGRRRMISYVGSYHGQTTGSAVLSGHQTQASVIGLGNVTKVPYPDPYRCMWGPCSRDGCSLACLRHVERYALETISPADDTAAIIIEAVQSDGGDIVPPANYLPALRELCDRHGIWLVFDEVKIGMGRTGRMFGFEHSGVVPDAVVLAKPLGGGLPLSAVVGRRELLDVPTYDLFTLGGSPVPCAAALAMLDVLADERLVENAAARGRQLVQGLEALKLRHPLIGDVRGIGLIVGVELVTDSATKSPASKDAHRVAYRCFELGLLVIYAGIYGNVIELTPPLSITEQEIDEALSVFDHALTDVEAGRFDDTKLDPYAGW